MGGGSNMLDSSSNSRVGQDRDLAVLYKEQEKLSFQMDTG